MGTEVGDIDLAVPRDRNGSFEPRLVPKGQRRVGGLSDMIISLCAGGMTVRDIQAHLERMLGTELSHETISNITDAMLEEVKARVNLYGAPVEPALQQTSTETDLGFVPLLALHTRQGFYSDPIYGGNRNRVGWDVIGFPGPASLAEVHTGAYSTLDYIADDREHPLRKDL